MNSLIYKKLIFPLFNITKMNDEIQTNTLVRILRNEKYYLVRVLQISRNELDAVKSLIIEAYKVIQFYKITLKSDGLMHHNEIWFDREDEFQGTEYERLINNY